MSQDPKRPAKRTTATKKPATLDDVVRELKKMNDTLGWMRVALEAVQTHTMDIDNIDDAVSALRRGLLK